MDILRAEIERKRKQLEQFQTPGRKYFKRSELDKDLKLEPKSIPNEEKNIPVEQNVLNKSDSYIDNINEQSILPRNEVIQKLRERGEPILLFGESELGAFRRLRHLEIYEPEVIKGFRNDFQEAMEKVDEVYLNEMLNNDGTKINKNDGSSKSENKEGEKDMTYEQILEIYNGMSRGNNRELETKIVINFLHLLIKLWNDQLNNRPAEEKMGTKGKIAFATYKQTQLYLKPLFRKLKTNTLPEDIFESLVEIIKHLLKKNYIDASGAYLQMAIGNAPWPIGVTMVGIHARTGREKIFSKNVAHVLNDETQRKYIQALKRLMTKCQEFFPTDPSRCVEYQPTN